MSTRTTLADGRELLFFSLPGHTPTPVEDRRPLPPWEPGQSQLRYDCRAATGPDLQATAGPVSAVPRADGVDQ